jgi:hypothetical protein
LVWLGPFICFERDPQESVHTPHLREMLESFAAPFSLSDTFSQRLNRKAWANHSAVLKAVGNRFGHAVDANGHAINSRVDYVWGQGIARKPDEAQSQTVDDRRLALPSMAMQFGPELVGRMAASGIACRAKCGSAPDGQ